MMESLKSSKDHDLFDNPFLEDEMLIIIESDIIVFNER
jgi:hypothetical protein